MIKLHEALEQRYLIYALSTIMDRALPDVRDGLKPVHRRILYAMRELNLNHNAGFKKSARIIGDVIGKFHPHNETSVYDALARLAQDFAMRYPLVDGQGNFGNIDGDNPAAMRYTEARMTKLAELLMVGLNQNAIDFNKTYDGENREPVVLPASIPNLLANGSSGIAVGMATSIPPHNLIELCNAALLLINNPQTTITELLEIIPAPDFPTGGQLINDRQSIITAYQTGKGSFRLRASWHKETGDHNQWQIVITEIPYQVAKARLIEKIAKLILTKKIPMLIDILDESTEDVRIVLKPKSRNVDPELLMQSLYLASELEVRIPLNMNVLKEGKIPGVLNLIQVLQSWLDHRLVVLIRRSKYRLEVINQRLEILDGLLIAYLNLDEVIRIIRWEDKPKQKLIATFKLTIPQSEAILNIRLRFLRQLEEMALKREHKQKDKERTSLDKLLNSTKLQWQTIAAEIKAIRDDYSTDNKIATRRTKLVATTRLISAEYLQQTMIEKEPLTIILSRKGWIRTVKGHLEDFARLGFKGDDRLGHSLHCQSTDRLLVFSSRGKCFTLEAAKLPSGRGVGEPIRLMIALDQKEEVIHLARATQAKQWLLVSANGQGFIANSTSLVSVTRKGKHTVNLNDGDSLALVRTATGDSVAIIGDDRKLLIFPTRQVPILARGKGVRLQRYKQAHVNDAQVFNMASGLSWSDAGGRKFTRSVQELKQWLGNRGQVGRAPPYRFPRSGKFWPAP